MGRFTENPKKRIPSWQTYMLSQFRTAISKVSGQAGGAALDLVFPAVCRLCDVGVDRERDFCPRCETALQASDRMMKSTCPRCGRPGQTAVAVKNGEELADSVSLSCQRCKDLEFNFDRVIPLWAYLDQVRDAIVTAKYTHQSPLGDALGRRLAERVRSVGDDDQPDIVTIVPSHFTRQFSRGGNANLTIATAVATGIDRPCRQLLRITRRIEKQAWLDESERAKNVRGAFAPKKSYALPRSRGLPDQPLAGQHILVVDDVLTTGATANEVAHVLKNAGAKRVTIAVVARAVS